MKRFALPVLVAALVGGGSVACSSDEETRTSASTERTTEQTTGQVTTEPREEPPPVAAPGKAKRKRVYQELARARDRGVSGAAVYRQVAKREGLDVPSVRLIEHEGSLRRWALPAPPKLSPAAVRAGRPWGATRLRSSVDCSANAPRTGIAHLHWRPAKRPGGRQWIAVTIFLRGFEFGKFEAAGPLPARASSFEWHRVHGQSIHLWRVITRQHGRWLGSPTARFVGPTCVAEFEP